MRKMIGIVGGRDASESLLKEARTAGREIASKGDVLICGGMGGVMEAACRGAREAGGLTIGILPTDRAEDANPCVEIVIPTGLGTARNAVIVNACHGVLAIGGMYGTLSEVAFALQRGIPVVSLQSWQPDQKVIMAGSAIEAVSLLYERIESGRRDR